DISASVVIPKAAAPRLSSDQPASGISVKFIQNCEQRLFQRPDDAIHQGYDRQTELEFSQTGHFFSNYEPLKPSQARELTEDAIGFARYTEPMQNLIQSAMAGAEGTFVVVTSHPRIVDGKPSKNPRYLQRRPDLANPRASYLGEIATRFFRRIPLDQPVHTPVQAVLPGRRNNGPDSVAGIRSLAVYSPIHYMELPELFMEFICSMTGKSPSTTGAGSEGALTKGPFNALAPIIDLNAALVSSILCGTDGFVTAAGCVGPQARMDHDISLLIPEVWCRMSAAERDPAYLKENGYLAACSDMEHNGQKLEFSRLGHRITARFVHSFFGRVFNHPHVVFEERMLKPELQSMELFVEGLANVIETQRRVAALYFEDGSVEMACPPLKGLLHMMRDGVFEGMTLQTPAFRQLFMLERLLGSDWYEDRLRRKQVVDAALWQRHIRRLEEFLGRDTHRDEATRLGLAGRLKEARCSLMDVESPDYLARLRGALGVQPDLR
ncbi:MAG: hypothetical protein HYR88_08235, partial [Verrucomicrobia bacterium]|nr:hypothetical protein [Verrucomicrobiota bacterium]